MGYSIEEIGLLDVSIAGPNKTKIPVSCDSYDIPTIAALVHDLTRPSVFG